MQKPVNLPRFRRALLSWYDREKRDLPWRRTKDPYAVFVSEMMLQQTQVRTVLPYYQRFLETFPDWKALAAAPEERVLALWAGLGYYRRARHLQAAARKVVEEYGGKLPDSEQALRSLPGVGPYTAGALLSIAHGKPHPLVDGNVARVYARIFRIPGNVKAGPARRLLWEKAREVVDPMRPADFNQALMELGARVCLPEVPACLLCPVRAFCGAAFRGEQKRFPETAPRVRAVPLFLASALVRNGRRILVRRRGEEERWWRGFWEFPTAEGKSFAEARRNLERVYGLSTKAGELREVRFTVTHHRIRLRFYPAAPARGFRTAPRMQWRTKKELESLPMASAQAKLRKTLTQPRRNAAPASKSFQKS